MVQPYWAARSQHTNAAPLLKKPKSALHQASNPYFYISFEEANGNILQPLGEAVMSKDGDPESTMPQTKRDHLSDSVKWKADHVRDLRPQNSRFGQETNGVVRQLGAIDW